ncbi:MAG: site-specific DNA-methyltransferase [Candidatus Goldbacteria bacterium]|nr:site-specific DNA-methyltransferase [Candidatus Goldiibacteriota bacterium]
MAKTSNKYKKLLDAEKMEKRAQVHSFHRYFGKLIPAIPRFAIKSFTVEGDLVLDPFCGSGTTLVESKMLNRNSVGIDLNPLSAIISKAKTTGLDYEKTLKMMNIIISNVKNEKDDKHKNLIPFCINMEHWFRSEVIKDLALLKNEIKTNTNGNLKNFYLACFSAMIRDVSNADPRHIFPGYSKRMRRIDAEEGRVIDVLNKFEKVVIKRVQSLKNNINGNHSLTRIYTGSANDILNNIRNVKLVVTNPPYISSIRYLETSKLEMYWLEILKSQKDYFEIDKNIVGTERFYSKDYKDVQRTNYSKINKLIKQIYDDGNFKMSKVVSKYFNDMESIFEGLYSALDKNAHMVFKISDSMVRKVNIPTHSFFIEIAKSKKFKLVSKFKDKIESRSLLTKRNYYSGMMSHDWILIFKK